MTQQLDRDRGVNPQSQDMMDDLLRKHVIRSLGSPDDLLKIQVKSIGGDRYRVNVFVGKEVTSGRITDSFFLTADSEGNILKSSPEIVKLY